VPADRLHTDFDVVAQGGDTIEHLRFADAPEAAAEHVGNLGLAEAHDPGSLLLGEPAALDDPGDVEGQLGLHQHFPGIGKAKIGVDVTGTLFDFCQVSGPPWGVFSRGDAEPAVRGGIVPAALGPGSRSLWFACPSACPG